MKHDDPFFEMFRSGLSTHEAVPSAAVWEKVNARTKKGGFWQLSWTQMNVFYLIAASAMVAGLFVGTSTYNQHAAGLSVQQISTLIFDREASVMEETTLSISEVSETMVATTNRSRKNTSEATSMEKAEVNHSGSTQETASAETQENLSAAESLIPSIPIEEIPTNDNLVEVKSDLSNLKSALDSNNDKLFLRIPVRVKVDD
ncbi:MAG: hypothetical protein RL226_174 [Bacteroidota bacterium]